MPIYEYKCENGHVFDIMQRMSEDPLEECVQCSASVKKVLQPVGISFKGSGFYSTDYSKKGPKSEPKETAKTDSTSSDSAISSNGNGSEKKSETSSTGDAAKAKKAD